jgi:Activator of mitotic machinery Cdc14 phosphatase activation C-term
MPPGARNNQSLEQMSSHPSPLPGNDTNTGNLSFIPTFSDDKKGEDRRAKEVKKDDTRKSSWGWLLGKEETENKDKRLETLHSKPKAKVNKPPEKHDNTRLDVLQNSIEGGRGRESLVLDRNHLKLEEERKKENARKTSGGDGKKEKDGLFSSIFGGGKKNKGDRDSSNKKHNSRGLSPDPPHKVLKPDVDYNWTRFSILEERAIYRMAHIKLANPRRALYSQVLLSNFMYSYLAKVQQMHPQMNLPTSAKQQKKQQQQGKEQPDEFTQYQRYQQVFFFRSGG